MQEVEGAINSWLKINFGFYNLNWYLAVENNWKQVARPSDISEMDGGTNYVKGKNKPSDGIKENSIGSIWGIRYEWNSKKEVSSLH